jgi:hypothetical protein
MLHSAPSPQALSFQPSAFSLETGVLSALSAFIGGPHGLSRMNERPCSATKPPKIVAPRKEYEA